MSHVFLPSPSLEFAFQHGKPSAQAAFKRELADFKVNEVLGFTPMRVELTRTADSIVSVPVYLVILAFWSALLIYRVRKSGRKESFPWR